MDSSSNMVYNLLKVGNCWTEQYKEYYIFGHEPLPEFVMCYMKSSNHMAHTVICRKLSTSSCSETYVRINSHGFQEGEAADHRFGSEINSFTSGAILF